MPETAINITVNGETAQAPRGATLAAFLDSAGLKPERLVVELNQQIAAPEAFAKTTLQDGDSIELIHFVGGG